MDFSFEKYLILVGIRSEEYTYSHDDILNNIEYFRRCYNQELSAYKALLFLHDHLNENSKMDKKLLSRKEVLSDIQIDAAFIAYERHKMHIDNIVSYATKAYPPTLAEDKSYPMIWKAEHWKWFLNTVD